MIDEEYWERLIVNLDCLAANVGRIATTMEQRLMLDHPEKKKPKDATITHLKTKEEEILDDQGYEKGELGRWLDIGTRERAFTEDGGHTSVSRSSVQRGSGKIRD